MSHDLVKNISALGIATLVTLALFFAMNWMIRNNAILEKPDKSSSYLNFIRFDLQVAFNLAPSAAQQPARIRNAARGRSIQVEMPSNHCGLGLRLAFAPHGPVNQPGAILEHQQGRVQSMEGFFARLQTPLATPRQVEACPTVIPDQPKVR